MRQRRVRPALLEPGRRCRPGESGRRSAPLPCSRARPACRPRHRRPWPAGSGGIVCNEAVVGRRRRVQEPNPRRAQGPAPVHQRHHSQRLSPPFPGKVCPVTCGSCLDVQACKHMTTPAKGRDGFLALSASGPGLGDACRCRTLALVGRSGQPALPWRDAGYVPLAACKGWGTRRCNPSQAHPTPDSRSSSCLGGRACVRVDASACFHLSAMAAAAASGRAG